MARKNGTSSGDPGAATRSFLRTDDPFFGADIESLRRPKRIPYVDPGTAPKRIPERSFKKGGRVKKTGVYKLHKGEKVIKAAAKAPTRRATPKPGARTSAKPHAKRR